MLSSYTGKNKQTHTQKRIKKTSPTPPQINNTYKKGFMKMYFHNLIVA